jgi:dipeptidyl aminopeptidase/acylaminoacyl peptidase
MRRASSLIGLVLLLLGIAVALSLAGIYGAHSQVNTRSLAPNAYLYYTLKGQQSFVLARAPKGSNGQPVGTPQSIAVFGNAFGQAESDSVASMQLSPDGAYLAIDGLTDHAEFVWVYDTQHMIMSMQPAHVVGNFLRWLTTGHSFLYRPMFPLGPAAPMDGGQWNPGLWVVDAATGLHKNIDIHVPSASLVDAIASPDGTHILYSTTTGLSMGSDAWLMNADGSGRTHLLSSAGGAQSIIGLFAWSPDGMHIAYERLSDSSTPFLTAGLWLMDAQGGQQRRLADTDGGHGFIPVWSPDSSKIAFVVRTNVGDRHADLLAQSLQCAIGVVDINANHTWLVASSAQTGMQLNTNPAWSADSTSITFTALNPANRVLGGTPRYWSAHVNGVQMQPSAKPLTPAMSHVVAAG